MNDDVNNLCNVKSLADIFAGYPLRGSVESLNPGDVSLIQMRNVTSSEQIDWPSVVQVMLQVKRTSQWLENGDVIFAARGANNYAVSLDNLPPKTVCAPQFYVLKIYDRQQISPPFLAWQMNQKSAQDYFKKTALGSRMMNIRRRAVENLEIAIPSLHKQELIVKMHQTAIAEKQVLRALITSRNKQMEAVAADLFRNDGDQSNG